MAYEQSPVNNDFKMWGQFKRYSFYSQPKDENFQSCTTYAQK